MTIDIVDRLIGPLCKEANDRLQEGDTHVAQLIEDMSAYDSLQLRAIILHQLDSGDASLAAGKILASRRAA